MSGITWQQAAAILTTIVLAFGGVTYTDLLGTLFQLKGMDYNFTGDITCGTDCDSYINLTTSYWRVCFAGYNDTKYENETLFKKVSRSRTLHVNLDNVDNVITTQKLLDNGSWIPYDIEVDWLVPTYGHNWRPIKDGDCWDRGKVNKIKLVGHKALNETIKWSFGLDTYVDIDPLWEGYTYEKFFTNLTYNAIEGDKGIAIFEVTNPMTTPLTIPITAWSKQFDKVNGDVKSSKIEWIDPNEEIIQQEVPNETCIEHLEPYCYTDNITLNITCENIITQECSITGTKSVDVIIPKNTPKPLKVIQLDSGETVTLKLTADLVWSPQINIDWFVFVNVLGTNFKSEDWAWWNQSFPLQREIEVNTTINLTDYAFQIIIDNNTNYQNDWNDIRFTGIYPNCTEDISQLRPYWVSNKVDGVNITVYVNSSYYIECSNGTQLFNYYNNSNVINQSDIDNTILFNDNFDDNYLNTTNYLTSVGGSGAVTETGGVLQFTTPSACGSWSKIRLKNSWNVTGMKITFDFKQYDLNTNSHFDNFAIIEPLDAAWTFGEGIYVRQQEYNPPTSGEKFWLLNYSYEGVSLQCDYITIVDFSDGTWRDIDLRVDMESGMGSFNLDNGSQEYLNRLSHNITGYQSTGLTFFYQNAESNCVINKAEIDNLLIFKYTTIEPTYSIGAEENPSSDVTFTVTLNSPANDTTIADATPDFNFTVSGSEDEYVCELFIDDVGYGITSTIWNTDSNIISGLVDIGYLSTPTVFEKDSTWYLISGETNGIFYGYNWTGSTWQNDTTIISGLVDIGYSSTPTVFEKDGTWYLISGENEGDFYGYNWTDSTWQNDTTIISGLVDIGSKSTPTVFEKDSTWYLISGENEDDFYGWNWTGSTWQNDTTIISGLVNIGYLSAPTVFEKDSTWYLISGKTAGTFNGWNWTGSTWQNDTTIISGLVDIGYLSAPTVFEKDSTWYLISGETNGIFYGYKFDVVINNTATFITANNTLTEGTYDWNINCTADSVTNSSEIISITIAIPPTYSLNTSSSTVIGENVLHSLKWEDDTNLSGYVFSFDNGTGSLLNDSWVTFSGVSNWSNVSKYINETIGAIIQWKVYANDTFNNWNASDTYSYITINRDTCLYNDSGVWDILCSDNCSLISTDLNGNDFTIIGVGITTGFSNISNYTTGTISSGCTVTS